jgi:superfamily I DNA/RNA helicase
MAEHTQMAKEINPWLDFPNYNQFSKEQKEVYGTSLDSNILINGAAGSGKTILAILRAKQLASKGKKILFITFTRILYDFTKLSESDNDIKLRNVNITYTSQMAKNVLGRHMKNFNGLTQDEIGRLVKNTGKYDHVIVDEGQDFKLKIYENIFHELGKVHTVCSDIKQGIYDSDFNSTDVKEIYSPMVENILDFTYRNPKNVLNTSMGFFIKRFTDSPSELKGTKVKLYNKTDGEVRLIHTNNEIQSIAEIIQNRGKNTVGVLLPNNEAVKLFYDGLTGRNLGKIEYKYNSKNYWDNNVSFDNTNPKVLTYHSSKGIQFDTVILPLLSKDYASPIKFTNKADEARAFYVAMTRTKKKLFFTRPGNCICPYLEDIPTDYLKTVQRSEDSIPTVESIFEINDDDDDDELPF